MADISKCNGEGCELKESCYRYTVPADFLYQAYIVPMLKGMYCNSYWEVEEKSDKYKCPKCETGRLEKTNEVLCSDPPKYPYRCNNKDCNYTKNFG